MLALSDIFMETVCLPSNFQPSDQAELNVTGKWSFQRQLSSCPLCEKKKEHPGRHLVQQQPPPGVRCLPCLWYFSWSRAVAVGKGKHSKCSPRTCRSQSSAMHRTTRLKRKTRRRMTTPKPETTKPLPPNPYSWSSLWHFSQFFYETGNYFWRCFSEHVWRRL